ncbi:MAG: tRNA pseudouridine(38-40) synthase TruA, partial [Bacteroidota bacterium]|nr:tRNA pseudouridine(38-40) synthase TruA [Bacteroidota bacterium]
MMTQVSRYKLTLSYDGQEFFGWQVQPEDITVQGVLQENIEKLFQEKITVTGCGRTDRGVHASHYVAHFDAQKEVDNLLYRLNKMLPDEVVVH